MSCRVHQRLDQAILEHKNGNLKKAEVIYKDLLKDQPSNQDIYYYFGNLNISLKKFKDAEKNFRKAIELKPDFFQAQMNLANTLKELNKLNESEEIYKKVIRLNANHHKAYFNLGCLQQEVGRLKEAEENFNKTIELKPDFFQAYMNLGSVLKNLNKFNDAENIYKKASLATRESFRKRLRNGDLDNNEIEIAVNDTGSNNTSFEIPGMPGANVGMINIGEMLGKSMGTKEKKKKNDSERIS